MDAAGRRLRLLHSHLASPPQASSLSPRPTLSTELETCDSFKFTASGHKLAAEQRQFYEKNGYLVIPKLLSEAEVEKYSQHFRDLCSGKVRKAPGEVLMKEAAVVKGSDKKHLAGELAIHKVQDFENDEVLFSYAKLPKVLEYVSDIIGPDVRSINSILINKPPHIGKSGSYMWHQDLYFFPFRPASQMVTTWTALEPVTQLNGCLEFIPGSHTGPLYEHGYLPDYSNTERNANYHGILNHDRFDKAHNHVYIEIGPGDTIFFNPNLVHASGPNRSNGFRKAIGVHYASPSCHFIDVKGTIQEQIGKEMPVTWSRRIGKTVSFQDVWRWKSRLLQGRDKEWWAYRP